MNDIIFEVLKIACMVVGFIFARYAVPILKDVLTSGKTSQIAAWARYAVLWVQQTLTAKTGAEKKAVVTEFLKGILKEKNIALSDEQLDVLIEAAVKQMKIDENAGIVIEAADAQEEKDGE
jgi:LL-H family phage holin